MAALRDVSVILLAIESFVLLLIPAIILGASVYGVHWLRRKLPPLFAQARKYMNSCPTLRQPRERGDGRPDR